MKWHLSLFPAFSSIWESLFFWIGQSQRGRQRGKEEERERERRGRANQNNQQHLQLPCSQKLITMLPEEVKEDYVGEIMGQNVTNRLIIFQMRIRICLSYNTCLCTASCTGRVDKKQSERHCNREATCFWLSIQPTNDLPGQFYVCLEEN